MMPHSYYVKVIVYLVSLVAAVQPMWGGRDTGVNNIKWTIFPCLCIQTRWRWCWHTEPHLFLLWGGTLTEASECYTKSRAHINHPTHILQTRRRTSSSLLTNDSSVGIHRCNTWKLPQSAGFASVFDCLSWWLFKKNLIAPFCVSAWCEDLFHLHSEPDRVGGVAVEERESQGHGRLPLYCQQQGPALHQQEDRPRRPL